MTIMAALAYSVFFFSRWSNFNLLKTPDCRLARDICRGKSAQFG